MNKKDQVVRQIEMAFFRKRQRCDVIQLLRKGDWEYADLAEALQFEQLPEGRQLFDAERFLKSLTVFTPRGLAYIFGYFLPIMIRSPEMEGVEYVMYALLRPIAHPEQRDIFMKEFDEEKRVAICRCLELLISEGADCGVSAGELLAVKNFWCRHHHD